MVVNKKHNFFILLKQNFLANKQTTFAFFMALSLAVYLVFSAVFGANHLLSLFFIGGGDAFMDFFNSCRDASLGLGAYTQRGVIYPPLANLLFYLFGMLLPKRYLQTTFAERYSWKDYPACFWVVDLFLILQLAFYIFVIWRFSPKSTKKNKLANLFLVFNAHVLFCLERGNVALFSLSLTLAFAFLFDSPKKLHQNLAIIFLAISVALKLYPALFSVLLLQKKRYADFGKLVALCLILLIVPSFCFGGPNCLIFMLKNVLRFSLSRSSSVAVSPLLSVASIALAILNAYFFLSVAIYAIAMAFETDKKTSILHTTLIFIAFKPCTILYNYVLCVYPLSINFTQTTKKSAFFFAFLILPMLFLPSPFSIFFVANPTVNSLVLQICVWTMLTALNLSTLKNLHKQIIITKGYKNGNF